MTQEEILDYNKSCALFLEAEEQQWYPKTKMYNQTGVYFSFIKDCYPNNKKYHGWELLQFHSDWNWIMEVLNKISSLDFGWKVTSKYVNIYSHIGDPRGEFNCECSINCPKEVIKDVIKTVNHFLIWYSLRTQPLPNYSIH